MEEAIGDALDVIVPDDMSEECMVALRPRPSDMLQWFILEVVGRVDVDLLPFQRKMMFCDRTVNDVRVKTEQKKEGRMSGSIRHGQR